MKKIFQMGLVALVSVSMSEAVMAQIGAPFIHDPATIAECNGKYYTWGTSGSGLVSEDGWVWTSGERIPNVGAAPDMLQPPAVDWEAVTEVQSLPAGARPLIPHLPITVSLQLQSALP